MAVVWLSGFEMGLGNAQGTGLLLQTPASANASVVTTAGRVKSGTYSTRLNPAATQTGCRGLAPNLATSVANGGVWMYLETLPTGDVKLLTVQGSTTEDAVIQYDQGTGKLAGFDPVNGQIGIYSSCPVLSADTWYWVAWKVDRSANTLSVTITPDGGSATDCGSLTNATGWTANNGWVALGNDSAQSSAMDVFYDDFIVCSGGTEYPLDPHEILAVTVGSDGTHSFTNNDFSTGDAGTQRANNYTDFHLMVDGPLPWTPTRSTTDNIAQRVSRTAGYVELVIEATASGKPDATGVRALLAYSSTGTSANQGKCEVRNSAGTAVELWGIFPSTTKDYSESSNFFKGAIVTDPGGWTKTELDQITIRLGGSGDISPIPTWQLLLFEIAYPIASGPANVTGSSAMGLTISYTTSASRRTFSSSTFPLTLGYTTLAHRVQKSSSTFPLAVSYTTSGRRAPRGASTFPLSISYTTSGKRAATGASTFPLTITYTTTVAAGPATQFGQSAFPLSVSYTTRGIRAPRGASTFPLAISYTTSGRRTTKSASTFPLSISYTTQAKRTVHGASTYPLVISYSSRPASPTGVSTFPLTMGFTSVGKVTRFGVSVRPLTMSFTTVGRATYKGASSFPLTVGYSSSGVRTGTGAALLPLVFLISSQWRAAVVPGDINVGDGGDMNVLLVDSRSVEELIVNNEVPRVSISEAGDADVAVTLSDT